MPGLTKKTLLLAALLATSSLAKDWQEGTADEDIHKPHKCTHDEQDFQEIGTLDVDEEDLNTDHTGRALASYPDFRAYGYYGFMGNAPAAYSKYVQNDLFPPIIDFFKKALKSKNPISGKLKISQSSICGYSTPSVLRNGVDADWVLIPKAEDSSSLGYVASTSTCFKASGTNRPLVGHIKVNRHYMKETSDVLTHEKNMMCVMHEVVHALGFSKSLYKYWKGVSISSATLDGATATVVSAEPLTSKLRKHFGCSTLKGAYMENSGGSGTGGSHFERRQFANEVMTSGLIHDMQFSELTLALLESTGWYVADYSMADPYNWGRGQGCGFLTQKCSSSSFNYPEYMCKSNSRGCTASGTSGGSCSTDSRSDNCKWIHPSTSYHCENSNADSYARLPNIQSFGRTAGSKCFTGTLSTSSGASQTSFCFKYSCSGSGSSTKLDIILGSKTVACNKKGSVTVSGYKGSIDCPDPVEYCATVGKKVCARGCMGRGTCNNGVCQCNKGFKGKDCALKA